MYAIKQKYWKLFAVATLVIGMVIGAAVLPAAAAGSHVSCGKGTTQEATDSDPPVEYCVCNNQAQVLVSATESCQAKCPKNTTQSTSHGQVTCGSNAPPPSASQCSTDNSESFCTGDESTGKYQCGSGSGAVMTTIDFGCKGANCKGNCSAPIDLTFAIIRFLSAGVGLVVVASMVIAGIQYTTSRGDPQASAAAMKRIQSTVVALFIYIFAFAILNYVIPAGFFNI